MNSGFTRTKMRRISKKRSVQLAAYRRDRAVFLLLWPRCAVFPKRQATEIHHVRGRFGARLLDEAHWLPVSREGHAWIHEHPKEAYAKGWLKLR